MGKSEIAPSRERVSFFPTCVVDTLAAEVGVSAVRVLRRLGWEVGLPGDATCCGQPAWNAGFADEAARVARTTLDALERTDGTICVPAGSCATMIRVFWPELFEVTGDHDAYRRALALRGRVREFSELVATRADRIAGSVELRVAYHHSCHMLRELRLHDQPEQLLSRAGARVEAWSADERCCGFGGLFSVKQPEMSVAMADDKIDSLPDCDLLVGCDESCLMHLRARMQHRGDPRPVRHLANVLDEATS
jgi:L-lactate dehydrogenase complex protein LldE